MFSVRLSVGMSASVCEARSQTGVFNAFRFFWWVDGGAGSRQGLVSLYTNVLDVLELTL